MVGKWEVLSVLIALEFVVTAAAVVLLVPLEAAAPSSETACGVVIALVIDVVFRVGVRAVLGWCSLRRAD